MIRTQVSLDPGALRARQSPRPAAGDFLRGAVPPEPDHRPRASPEQQAVDGVHGRRGRPPGRQLHG